MNFKNGETTDFDYISSLPKIHFSLEMTNATHTNQDHMHNQGRIQDFTQGEKIRARRGVRGGEGQILGKL